MKQFNKGEEMQSEELSTANMYIWSQHIQKILDSLHRLHQSNQNESQQFSLQHFSDHDSLIKETINATLLLRTLLNNISIFGTNIFPKQKEALKAKDDNFEVRQGLYQAILASLNLIFESSGNQIQYFVDPFVPKYISMDPTIFQ